MRWLHTDIVKWTTDTFGTPAERGPKGPLLHLIKEANEAIEAPTDHSEYADCLILVIDASHRAGMSYEDLWLEAYKKLQVLQTRTYPKVADGEVSEHIK